MGPTSNSPRVAVLIGREPTDRYSLHHGYVDALVEHGANPLVVVLGHPDCDERILETIALCDAVLLTGGHDVAPESYGDTNTGLSLGVDPDRDRQEIAAITQAAQRAIRVLGICRGAQILNVALGGTLHQDLPSAGFCQHMIEVTPHDPVHTVTTESGSHIARILDGKSEVNSLHHQAVKDLAPGARATAFADDGVIEAFEIDQCLAIQWHPERMLAFDPSFSSAFSWLTGSNS